MRTHNALVTMLVAISLSATCFAQDDAPGSFAYSTYYVCDVASQDDMDEIVEHYEKPVGKVSEMKKGLTKIIG